jgi:hypothetical protein
MSDVIPFMRAEGPQWLADEHLPMRPEPKENAWRTDGLPDSFEWWYFDALTPDGTVVVLTFYAKHPLDPRPGVQPLVRLHIQPAAGELMAIEIPVDPGQFSASKETCQVTAGGNSIESDGSSYRVKVSGTVDGKVLAADLKFTCLAPAWRPGAGKVYFGHENEQYFAWLAAVPDAHVEGELTYDEAPHLIVGHGYHDHNWGTIKFSDRFSHWHWGHGRAGRFNVVFAYMMTNAAHGAKPIPVFLLARGDSFLVEQGQPLRLEAPQPDVSLATAPPDDLTASWNWRGDEVILDLDKPDRTGFTYQSCVAPTRPTITADLSQPYDYDRFTARLRLKATLDGAAETAEGMVIGERFLVNVQTDPPV